MAIKNQQCIDTRVLRTYLSEKLGEHDEAKVVSHLDQCSSCQKVLEKITADPGAWDDLRIRFDDANVDDFEKTLDHFSRPFDSELKRLQEYLGPTDDPNMLGRLGEYEVCGLVGRGSTGIVVKAFEPRLNRFVAIKILSPSLSDNGSSRKRFEREGRSIAAVSHEHVVPIYAVNEYRGMAFIVMQYVGGGSLQQRVEKDGPLSTKEVVRIGLQVASGLAAAHRQGIVHRDVKPANVMLENSVDRAMVSDFGLARVVDEAVMTRSGVIAGTPQYMSPEQARGESIDPRSDLFSLGSVLYCCATGRSPFRSETVFGVIKRVCETEARPIGELNSDLPDWLIAFIEKLQAKDRDDRFGSADQVVALLEKELAHLQNPILGTVPQRPWYVKPRKRATGTFFGGVPVVALLLMAGLAGWMGFANGWFTPNKGNVANANGDVVAGFGLMETDSEELKRKILTECKRCSISVSDEEIVADIEASAGKFGMSPEIFTATIVEKRELEAGQFNEMVRVHLMLEKLVAYRLEKSVEELTEMELQVESKKLIASLEEGQPNAVSGTVVAPNETVVETARPGQLTTVSGKFPGGILDGYSVYLPESYGETNQAYPVILFLSGGCAVGGEVKDMYQYSGMLSMIHEQRDELQGELRDYVLDSFIIVSPHMKDGIFDERQFFAQEDAMRHILESVKDDYRSNMKQVYVAGIGRGGHGAWGLASRMPEYFAAAVPIRGQRIGITDYETLAKMPIWVGHSIEDDQVSYGESSVAVNKIESFMEDRFLMVEQMDASGSDFLEHDKVFTSLEGNDWPNLFTRPELYQWLLAHERSETVWD